jgi:hypothetical protein
MASDACRSTITAACGRCSHQPDLVSQARLIDRPPAFEEAGRVEALRMQRARRQQKARVLADKEGMARSSSSVLRRCRNPNVAITGSFVRSRDTA